MTQYTPSEVEKIVKDEVTLSLEELLRAGARRMLQAALEFEVETYLPVRCTQTGIESFQDEKDDQGHRQVVRNGSHKPRELITGVGQIPIRQPRVHDRREGKAFTCAVGTADRSTNPIESTFGTVRHRTRQTKGCGSRVATLMMVYKLARQAQKNWQRLHSSKLIELVVQGVQFQDGEIKKAA